MKHVSCSAFRAVHVKYLDIHGFNVKPKAILGGAHGGMLEMFPRSLLPSDSSTLCFISQVPPVTSTVFGACHIFPVIRTGIIIVRAKGLNSHEIYIPGIVSRSAAGQTEGTLSKYFFSGKIWKLENMKFLADNQHVAF